MNAAKSSEDREAPGDVGSWIVCSGRNGSRSLSMSVLEWEYGISKSS